MSTQGGESIIKRIPSVSSRNVNKVGSYSFQLVPCSYDHTIAQPLVKSVFSGFSVCRVGSGQLS